MADLASLEHMVAEARACARQASRYSRMARARATRTMQEVQRACHRARMACLALSMPEANPLTLTITANILASYGLLDKKPTFGPPVRGCQRRSIRPTRPSKGGRR